MIPTMKITEIVVWRCNEQFVRERIVPILNIADQMHTLTVVDLVV